MVSATDGRIEADAMDAVRAASRGNWIGVTKNAASTIAHCGEFTHGLSLDDVTSAFLHKARRVARRLWQLETIDNLPGLLD